MRKFRKTAAVVAAAALALSLCACGGKTEKATTEQISGGGATVTDATASTIEDDGDWTTTEQEVVEDDRFTTVEGADAIGVTFDDGTDGFTSYTNNGNFTMSAENGELVCDITKSGPTLYKMIDQKYISDYKKHTGERMVKVYYHLEDVGRERLEALVSEYREFSQVMNEILNLK